MSVESVAASVPLARVDKAKRRYRMGPRELDEKNVCDFTRALLTDPLGTS